MEDRVRQHLAAGRFLEAFELLVPSLQHKVFRLAFSLLRDEGLAQDAAQDAFLRVWRALPYFEGRSSPSTWVYAIARNVCFSRARTLAADNRLGESHSDPPTPAPARASIDLELALRRLPGKYRQALELFYFEDKSCETVARMLDLPVATVKTHLRRARKQLRDALEEQQSASNGPGRTLAAGKNLL
ncbi:MAG: sigma-70 family RNA polymerase sigma factor [Bryobacteraceae bacterium]|nr:sigma-70 family RNA polymerase sigma factor [Bryobacteraceae bacterium]